MNLKELRKMQHFFKKKYFGIDHFLCLYLLFTTLLAFLLRSYLIPQNLFFGPEQGRDFLVVKDIVLAHKFTLIGPKTDIGGIFHGPLFYYLLVIPFLFSGGDIIVSSIFLICIQSLTVIIIYLLGFKLVNKRVGIIASILFAVSFNSIMYARWLSNPPLSIPFVVLAMLFLLNFLKGSKKSLLGFSVCLGLLNQAEFLNIIFYYTITFGIVIIFFERFKKITKVFLLLNLILSVIISVGTFVLFDLRHEYLILKSVLGILTHQTGYQLSFFSSLNSNVGGYLQSFTSTIFPFHDNLGSIMFISSFIYLILQAKKKKDYYLLVLWLITPLFLLVFLRHDALEQFFVSIVPAYVLLFAIALNAIWNKSKIMGAVALVIAVSIESAAWIQHIPKNTNIFFQSTQLELNYADQIRTIDRIYLESAGLPFAIQSYTIPYWSQEGWTYLFWSHGYKNYGKFPLDQNHSNKLFVIIQDDPGSQQFQRDWLKNTVSKWGTTEKTFRYGALTTRKLLLE